MATTRLLEHTLKLFGKIETVPAANASWCRVTRCVLARVDYSALNPGEELGWSTSSAC